MIRLLVGLIALSCVVIHWIVFPQWDSLSALFRFTLNAVAVGTLIPTGIWLHDAVRGSRQ